MPLILKLPQTAVGNGSGANENVSYTETFNPDGSITTTYVNGGKAHTVFNSDGSITKTTSVGDVVVEVETIIFNDDGSITTKYEKGV